MSEDDKKDGELKIIFAPGVLEFLETELTPEEMIDFKAQLDELASSTSTGADFTDSSIGIAAVDLEELEREDPEVYAALMAQMDLMGLPTDGGSFGMIEIDPFDKAMSVAMRAPGPKTLQ